MNVKELKTWLEKQPPNAKVMYWQSTKKNEGDWEELEPEQVITRLDGTMI